MILAVKQERYEHLVNVTMRSERNARETRVCLLVRVLVYRTLSSKTAMPMPLDAPEPARPTKWPLPMLLANSDAPTCMGNRKTVVTAHGQ